MSVEHFKRWIKGTKPEEFFKKGQPVRPLVIPLEKSRPHKYKRRWKDAKGNWQYEYEETRQLGLFEKPKKKQQPVKPVTRKETDAKMKQGLEVEGYALAGTPAAFELIGPHETANCVRCGSPIAHVFATNKGAMGGDCLATLTGDDSTRRLAKKINETIERMKGWHGVDKVTGYSIEHSPERPGSPEKYVIRMHTLDEKKLRIDEHSGEAIAGVDRKLVITIKPNQLGWAASMIEQRSEAEKVEFEMPQKLSKARVSTLIGAYDSPAEGRSPGPTSAANFAFEVPKKRQPAKILADDWLDLEELVPKTSVKYDKETLKMNEHFKQEPKMLIIPMGVEIDPDEVERNRKHLDKIHQSNIGPKIQRPVVGDES
jgi:hypothetical protein